MTKHPDVEVQVLDLSVAREETPIVRGWGRFLDMDRWGKILMVRTVASNAPFKIEIRGDGQTEWLAITNPATPQGLAIIEVVGHREHGQKER